MPTCRDVTEMATDWMEGALGWRDRLGVRWHLRLCPMCRAHVDQLGKTRQLLARGVLPGPEPVVEERLVGQAMRDRPD